MLVKPQIREKIHQQYPFLPQSLVRDLSQWIQQHEFYTIRQGKIVFRMTPLLQLLKTPSQDKDMWTVKKKQLVLRHLTNPIPPLTTRRQRDEMDLLLGISKYTPPTRWNDVFYLLRLVYKYRHHMSCLSPTTYTTHNTLTIHHNDHELRITPAHVYVDNQIVNLDFGTPTERETARILLLHYLACIRSIYANKADIINQIMYGSQRIGFLPTTQAVKARSVSKQITRRPPHQQQSKFLRQSIQIPLHIIKVCHLDEVVSVSTKINPQTYEQDIRPHLTAIHEDGFEIRENADMNKLLDVLFPPRSKTCMTYAFVDDHTFEVYIYCLVKIVNESYNGVFVARFYNDFVEFTETTVQRSTNTIINRLVGDAENENMLQYNTLEQDLFLGWDVDKDTMEQYQRLRKQTIRSSRLPDRSDFLVKNIVYLFEHAVQTQKTRKILNLPVHPLSDWSENADEQNVYLFPTLS